MKTIFGKGPLDRTTEILADFIFHALQEPDIEIEAKFGQLIDKSTGKRIILPVLNDVVLNDSDWFRFSSDMTREQHKMFNEMFNKRVEDRDKKVQYKHTKQIDEFYEVEKRKIRLSRDLKGNVVDIIEKSRLRDLHLHFPALLFDCRISINIERKVEVRGVPRYTRKKDRLTYTFDLFQFDLTQVTAVDGGVESVLHELEIEIVDIPKLIDEAEKASKGIENCYIDQISSFLGNISVVARSIKR